MFSACNIFPCPTHKCISSLTDGRIVGIIMLCNWTVRLKNEEFSILRNYINTFYIFLLDEQQKMFLWLYREGKNIQPNVGYDVYVKQVKDKNV